jgi:photosynthetic reaction center cytochrome c subunit
MLYASLFRLSQVGPGLVVPLKIYSELKMKLNILRLLVVTLACASAVMLFTNARAQKSPVNQEFAVSPSSLGMAMPAQTPAAPAAPQEKTVDQTRKNIQVLKGLPDSQLGTVMQFIAVSMGRRCDFCHVNKGGNNWVWESDEKEEKLTARKMMTMVLALNKDNFRGSPTVSCYTCHRGRSTPVGIPSLPVPTPQPRPQPPAQTAPGQPAATPTPTPAPPTADQILAKYIEALGGQAAIDKMKTLVMKGTYAGFNGTSLPYEVDMAAPDKFYINVTAQQGTVERGFDGKAGWEKGPRGVNELMNPVLDDLKSTFLFYRNIKLKEQFAQMRGARKDKIGDRDVYAINGTTPDKKRERLFFDAETGLLLRRISYMETPIGVIPNQIDFEDYRDVDGVKVPFTVRVLSVEPGLVSTRKYTEIKLNAPVDDSKFKMPAAPAKATP